MEPGDARAPLSLACSVSGAPDLLPASAAGAARKRTVETPAASYVWIGTCCRNLEALPQERQRSLQRKRDLDGPEWPLQADSVSPPSSHSHPYMLHTPQSADQALPPVPPEHQPAPTPGAEGRFAREAGQVSWQPQTRGAASANLAAGAAPSLPAQNSPLPPKMGAALPRTKTAGHVSPGKEQP